MSKVSVLLKLKDEEKVKRYMLEYYKEINSNNYDFYDNLNEVDEIVQSHFPGCTVVGIAPTTDEPQDEDVFGNEIPKETKEKDEL